jgi:hypothetical protein
MIRTRKGINRSFLKPSFARRRESSAQDLDSRTLMGIFDLRGSDEALNKLRSYTLKSPKSTSAGTPTKSNGNAD